MSKKIRITEKNEKSMRGYRRLSLSFVFVALCISIWSTMMTSISWSFKDIAFELISLLIIIVCGMFANVNNRFSLFHIRGIRITKERLISILIGIFLPVSFLIYFMISDNEFMKYLKDISLHDFITLSVLLMPLMMVITLIVYFSYKVIEPKYIRERNNEYIEKTEKSLNEYKMIALTFVSLTAITSIWIKIAFNYNWELNNIKTEVILLIIIILMKIISNLKNKLPWYYSERLGYSKYLYICLIIPYLVFGLACLISSSLREKIMLIGIPKTISLIALYSPIVGLMAVVVSCFNRIFGKLTNHTKKYGKDQINIEMKRDNIITSLALTLLSVMLVFIYIVIAVLDSMEVGLIFITLLMLIPVGIIIYLVIYYSMITINK